MLNAREVIRQYKYCSQHIASSIPINVDNDDTYTAGNNNWEENIPSNRRRLEKSNGCSIYLSKASYIIFTAKVCFKDFV